MTKIAKILQDKNLTQRDLQRMILLRHGTYIGDDRMSRMVNGKLTNYSLRTAYLIAETLNVHIDDICEVETL